MKKLTGRSVSGAALADLPNANVCLARVGSIPTPSPASILTAASFKFVARPGDAVIARPATIPLPSQRARLPDAVQVWRAVVIGSARFIDRAAGIGFASDGRRFRLRSLTVFLNFAVTAKTDRRQRYYPSFDFHALEVAAPASRGARAATSSASGTRERLRVCIRASPARLPPALPWQRFSGLA